MYTGVFRHRSHGHPSVFRIQLLPGSADSGYRCIGHRHPQGACVDLPEASIRHREVGSHVEHEEHGQVVHVRVLAGMVGQGLTIYVSMLHSVAIYTETFNVEAVTTSNNEVLLV